MLGPEHHAMDVFMNDPSIRKFREWRCYL